MTPQETSNEAAKARDPVEELAEHFLERYRRGERPSLSEFIDRAPEYAEEIRELFPALVLMEQADPAAASLTPPAAHAACHLERLGDYRLLREVGRGGMGIVYEAEQEALGRHVALKILPFSPAADSRCLERFRREARSAARLHHTNIVPVFDIGDSEGVHYYAMQFIQGQGLDEVIVELHRLRRLRTPSATVSSSGSASLPAASRAASLAEGLLSGEFRREDLATGLASQNDEQCPHGSCSAVPDPSNDRDGSDRSKPSVLSDHSDLSAKSDFQFYRSVARIGLQVADALAYAHSQRVLHRDIKPSNLLLDACGIVWVTDFGLAKEEGEGLTLPGDVVGTLRYLAPERLNGVSEARSDVYGLGVTLYELLTLQPAFPETDRARLVQRITRHEPVAPRTLDPRVPRDLETIVLKAIAKEPARRFATALDMAEDLRRFLMDRPIRARRASQLERTWRWCRRNPGWAATIATALGLLLFVAVGGSVLSLHLHQALGDAQTADAEKTEKLWQSYLERARALRSSGRVGQRFEALKAIREAVKIKVTAELRDEAVAALALPDVELAREWEGNPEDTALAYDDKFERYARINKKGEVTVYRLTAKGEEMIGRAPARGERRFFGLWMSPDGRFLAYAHSAPHEHAASSVRILKLDGPEPVLHLEEPKGLHLYALSFHRDGRHLAIGHQDGTISVYDLETKEPPRRLRIPHSPNGLAFHPRDLRLAVACRASIHLLDVATGEERPAFPDATRIRTWSFGLAWHPQGRVLAVAAFSDATIHLWDTQTAQEIVTPLEGHGSENVDIAFNEAGDRLLGATWNGVTCLWDAVTGRLMLTMPGRHGAQFRRDESNAAESLIGIGQNGTKLRLWRLADGRELCHLRRPKAEYAGELRFPVLDADDRILAAASRNDLCFFDLGTGRELASIRLGKDGQVFPRSFDRASGWMTSVNTGVLLWPARRDPDRPNIVRVGPPRLLAATAFTGCHATSNGRIRIVPQKTQTLVLDKEHPGRRVILKRQPDVRHAAVSPDGQLVATFNWWDSRFKGAAIWQAQTGRHVTDLAVEDEASGAFSPDGRWLVTNARNQGQQLWEVGSWRPGQRFPTAVAVCWSPDKRSLAVNDAWSVIRLVEPETGREVLKLTGPRATWYSPVCFTSDGAKLVAVAGDASALYVWDLRLIRKHLRELGMNWELPEFPPAADDSDRPLAVEVDPGILRPPILSNDRHALAAWSLMIALQPINPEAYLQRGLAYGRLRLSARALADYEKFLAITPKGDSRRPEVQRKLAELCNNVAWRHVKSPAAGKLPHAVLRLAEKAVEMEPHEFMYQNTLGVALYRAGRNEEAIRCLEKSLEDSGQWAAFDLYFLAMCHVRLGQSDKARAYFDRANAAVKATPSLSPEHLAELAAFRVEAGQVLGIGISKMK